MKDLGSRKKGFTLLELMVTVAVIAILLTLAVPNFINARRRAQASSCMNNLKLLYEAGQLWRVAAGPGIGWADPDNPGVIWIDQSGLIANDYLEEELVCPAGGTYGTPWTYEWETWWVDKPPTCSVGTNDTSFTWDDHTYMLWMGGKKNE